MLLSERKISILQSQVESQMLVPEQEYLLWASELRMKRSAIGIENRSRGYSLLQIRHP